MAGGGIGEAMLISAATGAGTAAVTGGDPLKGALLGAATGGIGHGIAGCNCCWWGKCRYASRYYGC
jgi:hypothetical protein